MENIRKTLNQIYATTIPITVNKYENNTIIRLSIAKPYDILGFSPNDWTIIQNEIILNWNQEEEVLQSLLTDKFNIEIKYKYENTLRELLPRKNIPTIILSILCQQIHDYAITTLSTDFPYLYEISDYLNELTLLTSQIPASLSAVRTYVLDINKDVTYYNVDNGVNLILWTSGGLQLTKINEIYGVSHVWDHYDFPHIHKVESFEHYKRLLLNAIRRTWIAMLTVSSGTKEDYTRVNYGYYLKDMLPNYTKQQYDQLAKLNYGIVISPPYKLDRILRLSFDEIESIVYKTLQCLRLQPSLNTVYITPKQLAQEKLLGNEPILDRYTLTMPETYTELTELYNERTLIQLPIGKSFEVYPLLSRIETKMNTGRPILEVSINNNPVPVLPSSYPNYTTPMELAESQYKPYLDILRNQISSQFSVRNIMSYVSPDNLNIIAPNYGESVVAYVGLNQNVSGFNITINDDIPQTIFEVTSSNYIPDYNLSATILNELKLYKQLLNINYTSINLTIIDPYIHPKILTSILDTSLIPYEISSYSGAIGSQVETLFNFDLLKSNMIYMNLPESQYLNNLESYQLFISYLKPQVLYNIEFVDFSSLNLLTALTSLISAIKLNTELNEVRLSFLPPVLNHVAVGLRVAFTLGQSIFPETVITNLQESDIIKYSRNVSPDKIIIDPVKSLTYSSKVIPRMGTNILLRCQEPEYQESIGYMTSLCRYVKIKCYSESYTFYEMYGTVDQSRIAIMDRLQMFRSNTTSISQELIPQSYNVTSEERTARLTYFELVTQTDRMLLYLYRQQTDVLANDLSDYGSAHFLNIIMTDNRYTMYDLEQIEVADVPGVSFVKMLLEWGEELPYIEGDDVLIYNSVFMNADAMDVDLSVPIIQMLRGVQQATNIYFNLPFMSNVLYESIKDLNIVELRGGRYYLKLSKYPYIPCLTESELANVLSIFPQPQYNVSKIVPNILDYYFTSRMIQRVAGQQTYYNAMLLHSALPLFVITQV